MKNRVNPNLIEELAAHYGRKVEGKSGRRGFRVGCPAHNGKDPNCYIWESNDGRIATVCHSHGCEPADILAAIERDTARKSINPKDWSFQGTYRRNREPVDVWRIDNADGTKAYPTHGTREGVPLLVHTPAEPHDADLIIIVEGEKAARAIQRAGHIAVSYMGGSGAAHLADYSALAGKTVAVWPDNDDVGRKAGLIAAHKAVDAGADVVWMLEPVGLPGGDAADIAEEHRQEVVADAIGTATEYQPPSTQEPDSPAPTPFVWTPLQDILDTPPARWLVDGILAEGSVSLLYGGPKVGKSVFLLALLKAMATGGEFLGHAVEQADTWLITEQSEHALAPQLRLLGITGGMEIQTALWRNQPRFETTEHFAGTLLREYLNSNPRPKVIAIDTLATFIDLDDSNDYSKVHAALEPVISVAQEIGKLGGAGTLFTHHSRKSGGEGSDNVLGSRAIAAVVDALLKFAVVKGDNRRRLSIQSRFGVGDMGDSIDVTLALPEGEYRLVNTGAEVEAAILDIVGMGVDKKATVMERLEEMDIDVSQRTVERHLSQLVKDEYLVKQGKSRNITYTIPE